MICNNLNAVIIAFLEMRSNQRYFCISNSEWLYYI